MKNKIFNVGDEVIALTNPADHKCQRRIKGNKYTVMAVNYCCGCGVQRINIGEASKRKGIRCHCGFVQSTGGLSFTNSDNFTKIDSINEAMEEAVLQEDYEFAAVLRDINKEI